VEAALLPSPWGEGSGVRVASFEAADGGRDRLVERKPGLYDASRVAISGQRYRPADCGQGLIFASVFARAALASAVS